MLQVFHGIAKSSAEDVQNVEAVNANQSPAATATTDTASQLDERDEHSEANVKRALECRLHLIYCRGLGIHFVVVLNLCLDGLMDLLIRLPHPTHILT